MKDNRMRKLTHGMFIIIGLLAFVGCQSTDAPLPTTINLDATNEVIDVTNEAFAQSLTETALAPTATSSRPTLPPTFTDTPDIPPTPTPIPTLDPNISPTPEGFHENGTIYYNYNGDSIARVLPDGSLNEIIVTFGIDQPITDLTASPDGQLLAFVAPSGGSAREVWVSNRDGSYLQQVSCLGFGEVRQPTFAPDSNRIAFFAAPLATTEMFLYVADFAGSNDCPAGNNQRQLFPVATTFTGDITWNAAGDMIYYNAGGTYVYDFGTAASYIVSGDTGFGTDFGLTYSDTNNQLGYLRLTRDLTTGEQGGSIVVIEDADTFRADYTISPLPVYAQSLEWVGDSEAVLYTTTDQVIYYEVPNNLTVVLQEDLANPLAIFAPNDTNYAYTTIDPTTNVPQIYTANRLDDRDTAQVTFNTEGTINSILWLEG